MLIALQCHQRGIGPQRVAGFRAWLKLGRCVRKGEAAIRILAPVAVKDRDPVTAAEKIEPRVFFETTFVFDVSQTEPLPGADPAPLEPAPPAADRRLARPAPCTASGVRRVARVHGLVRADPRIDRRLVRHGSDADRRRRRRAPERAGPDPGPRDHPRPWRRLPAVHPGTSRSHRRHHDFLPRGDRNSRWRLAGACVPSVTDGAASSSFTVRSGEQRGRAGLLSGRTVNRSDDEKLKAPTWPTRSTRSTRRLSDKRRLEEGGSALGEHG
jgi:hypothetical protein